MTATSNFILLYGGMAVGGIGAELDQDGDDAGEPVMWAGGSLMVCGIAGFGLLGWREFMSRKRARWDWRESKGLYRYNPSEVAGWWMTGAGLTSIAYGVLAPDADGEWIGYGALAVVMGLVGTFETHQPRLERSARLAAPSVHVSPRGASLVWRF
ncbi:MAG: hypothetical protein ACYTKD_17080 [Planctomycetota bacterium]